VIDEKDIAWAAGLFEGEGCFYLGRTMSNGGRYENLYAKATVTSTDEDVIRKFHSFLGFGQVTGPTPDHRGKNRKVRWTWETGKWKYFQEVVTMFWPFLSERRKDKAAEILTAMGEYKSIPYGQKGLRK
jgi:hypothetical protein